MSEIQLLLEAVTPIFLNGAPTGRGTPPELRGAPFRGQLRYWFRTLHPNLSIADLSNLESQIFGSTETGSRVNVITYPKNSKSMPVEERLVLPHNPHRAFTKNAFAEGSQFYLRIRIKDRASIESLFKSLLLLVNFSGVGNRVRRGFGSLKITDLAYSEELEDFSQGLNLLRPVSFKNYDETKDFYSDLLSYLLKDRFNATNAIDGFPRQAFTAPYSSFAENAWCILVTKNSLGFNYEDAMRDFWHNHLRSYAIMDDKAFGTATHGRRSSPFHLHMIKAADGYHLVLIAFNAKPMPTYDSWKKHFQLYQSCLKAYGGTLFFSPERDNTDE